MQSLRNFSIGQRLVAGFLLILSLCILVAGIGVWRLHVIERETRELMATPLVKERLISDLNANVAAGIRRTLAIIKSSDLSLAKFFVSDATDLTKSGNEITKKVEAMLASDEERREFERLTKARKEYIAMRDEVMKEKAAGNTDAVNKLFEEKFNPAVTGYQKGLQDMLKFQRGEMDSIGTRVGVITSQSSMLLEILAILIVALGSCCAWALTRSITAPLATALSVVKTVARGDLTADIRAREKDELGQLLNALQDMNDNLEHIVVAVRSSTDSIATASSEISSGNLDLSSRTEQQAASLQETASSMEELTSTVKRNADNARQANEQAISASDVAAQGGVVVAQVVDTMSSISESSQKIVEIISTIDGIAFQTNILALNAAVEAARAGEQGRGFAVVATEVRSLAQRSAAAAKEIKSLIESSVGQVEAGNKLVEKAGSTMNQVVAGIRSVSAIVGEIAIASQEQSAGIEQVNRAVSQMDQTTRQNAALVEEATAATGALQQQATALSQAVAVFTLKR
ncbi:methyl-accepting chemotaxis protein [Noviherbaspirillum pedocola]|uniref:MCP four helix bundle domain-containing protein n=1 Tax=Noviherbaspirillum pedocola TaxID=2801341 RepID=A0A934T0H3_9BURK|nr:methyl-accepting chemotaxis protein [Noviherbaspirillum pedocola]MBK4739114.1 MCP four helix bundle domain-containing protein [Noviherbaspirillum pedocola]